MFYHWLGWISFAMCMLLLAKYIGRKLSSKRIHTLFRKIHKPFGIAVIGIGAIHGVISMIKQPQEIAEIFSGVFLWALIVLLARTYYARAKLKTKWFKMHRHFAIILMVILVIHIAIAISL